MVARKTSARKRMAHPAEEAAQVDPFGDQESATLTVHFLFHLRSLGLIRMEVWRNVQLPVIGMNPLIDFINYKQFQTLTGINSVWRGGP